MVLSNLVDIKNEIKSIEESVNDFENMWKTTNELTRNNLSYQLATITEYLNDRITNSSFSKISKTNRNSNIAVEVEAERAEFEIVLNSLNRSLK
jgi:hypothetical protein